MSLATDELPQAPRADDAPTQRATRCAVAKMIANGARFTLKKHDSGNLGFTYQVLPGGDRARCREIINRMKALPSGGWAAFVAALEGECR